MTIGISRLYFLSPIVENILRCMEGCAHAHQWLQQKNMKGGEDNLQMVATTALDRVKNKVGNESQDIRSWQG